MNAYAGAAPNVTTLPASVSGTGAGGVGRRRPWRGNFQRPCLLQLSEAVRQQARMSVQRAQLTCHGGSRESPPIG